jgi:hypothetical protein
MALHKYVRYIAQNNNPAFDALHIPRSVTPYSGICRCEVCGNQDVSTAGTRYPRRTITSTPPTPARFVGG